MPTLPIKTYWASMAHQIYTMCRFITRHQSTMLAVTAVVSPTDVVAVQAAFASIQTFCVLFEKIHQLVDPNAPPSE